MLVKHILFAALVTLAACARSTERKSPPPAAATPAPAPAPAAASDPRDAAAAYDAQQWARCAELFEAVAAERTGRRRQDALYNAACCHARDGKPDRAFALLHRAVQAGLRDVEHMQQDPDLTSLRADARWAQTIENVQRANATWEASLGAPALRREILALVAEDQRARFAWVKKQDDPALRDAVAEIDRKATARMKKIVAKHGWPGFKLVGEDGAHGAWLLVQHADKDPAFQKQCLALLEKAVAAGDADAQSHAYLFDRVEVAQGRPQRWGTQFANGEPQPIEDEANVDARRTAIGLPTMAQYREDMRRMYGDPEK